MITVGQLIEKLKQLPENAIVVLSSDAEGNKHSPLSEVDGGSVYVPENSWSGEIYADDGEGNEDLGEQEQIPCIVLVPVN